MMEGPSDLPVPPSRAPLARHALSRAVRPEDPAVTAAVVRHERGERAHHRAMTEGLPGNFISSHLGAGPILAERLGERDPRVLEVMSRLRAKSPEDTAVMRALRQHGGVGGYVPPLGGRAHRSLEGAVSQMPTQQLFQRVMSGNAPDWLKRLAGRVERGGGWLQKQLSRAGAGGHTLAEKLEVPRANLQALAAQPPVFRSPEAQRLMLARLSESTG